MRLEGDRASAWALAEHHARGMMTPAYSYDELDGIVRGNGHSVARQLDERPQQN